jgi:gliding motility-associated-like protein
VGSALLFYNDNATAGSCSGTQQSFASYTSTFTGVARVGVTRAPCLAWGGVGFTSATLSYRQINNLVFTSPSTAMCIGETRVLTANPGCGTFSGTGVSGNVFTAPSGVSSVVITYSLGACSVTQTININTASTTPTIITSNANNYCTASAPANITLSVSGGTLGTGAVIEWYADVLCGQGTPIGTGASITIPAPTNTTAYLVRYNGTCNATQCNGLFVTVNQSAVAPTSATASITSYCTDAPPATITLTAGGGTVPSGGTVAWYTSSCGGVLVGNGSPLTIAAPSVTTEYFVRYETALCGNTTCAATTVNVYSPSTAPTAATANGDPNLTYCSDNPPVNVLLEASGGVLGAGATVNWYTGSCGGTLVGTGNPLSIPAPTTTTEYFGRYESVACNTTGCVSTTVTANIISIAPTAILASDTFVCPSAPVTLTVQGGSLGTGAIWEWYEVNCGSSPIGSGDSIQVSPVAPTTYFVRAVGVCGNTACADITINIKALSNDPTGITTTNDNFCPGDSATLQVTGGSLGTGANWVWYEGTCCITPVATDSILTVYPTTTTSYFVRAEGDCNISNAQSTTLTVKIESVAAQSMSASTDSVCIDNNSVGLSIVGGSLGTGATWEWFADSCGGTPFSTGSTSVFVNPTTTTTYYARANGDCGPTACVSTTIIVSPGVVTDITTTEVTCAIGNDGTATATPTSGVPPFTYLWSTGDTTQTITGLMAKDYTVIVTDGLGCYEILIATVGTQGSFGLTVNSTSASCEEAANGTATPTMNGGVAPFNFNWGTNPAQFDSVAINVLPGTYGLTVTDVNGCIDSVQFAVGIVDTFELEVTTTVSSCEAADNGTASAIATGGLGNLVYEWSLNPSPNTSNVFDLAAGIYTVTVSDAFGCTETETFEVGSLPEIIVDIIEPVVKIYPGDTFKILIDINREGDYLYSWTPVDGLNESDIAEPTAKPAQTTTYNLLVTEQISNCMGSDTILIRVINDYAIPNIFTPNGDNINPVFEILLDNENIELVMFEIFNRWGDIIHSDITKGWDGTYAGVEQPSGSYIYQAIVKRKKTGEEIKLKGDVTLLR